MSLSNVVLNLVSSILGAATNAPDVDRVHAMIDDLAATSQTSGRAPVTRQIIISHLLLHPTLTNKQAPRTSLLRPEQINTTKRNLARFKLLSWTRNTVAILPLIGTVMTPQLNQPSKISSACRLSKKFKNHLSQSQRILKIGSARAEGWTRRQGKAYISSRLSRW